VQKGIQPQPAPFCAASYQADVNRCQGMERGRKLCPPVLQEQFHLKTSPNLSRNYKAAEGWL
jgi:hypothetical protein